MATRERIIELLKRRGPAGAADLAAGVGMTASAMRQHLTGLAADGLVEHEVVVDGPGRPKHRYRLTEEAEALFPQRYSPLVIELLDEVGAEDPVLLGRIFARRRKRRIASAKGRLAGLDLGAKVAELARILDEDGYLADWEPIEGTPGWRVIEHHCAILDVARRYGQACSSEIEFIRAVLPEAKVERVAHMVSGARMCTYEIIPRRNAS